MILILILFTRFSDCENVNETNTESERPHTLDMRMVNKNCRWDLLTLGFTITCYPYATLMNKGQRIKASVGAFLFITFDFTY